MSTIYRHIFLVGSPWALFIAALTVPSRHNGVTRGITYIADLCHIDARVTALLFFSLLWGACRIGNARLFKWELTNALLLVISTVAIELLVAFVICVVVFLANFNVIIQT